MHTKYICFYQTCVQTKRGSKYNLNRQPSWPNNTPNRTIPLSNKSNSDSVLNVWFFGG